MNLKYFTFMHYYYIKKINSLCNVMQRNRNSGKPADVGN